ncbi:MAG: valine--tRNA ligase [Acidimicrobiales bacterium]
MIESCSETTGLSLVPERPSLDGLEAKWSRRWSDDGTYSFDRTRQRSEVYSIDTPPPTVSGSLHLGTVFGYVQFDSIARFWRMSGKEVFFPIGWDDNGLPTIRRVQNHYGVRCDPTLAYEPALELDRDSGVRAVSRANFIELCERLRAIDEQAFERAFRDIGLSVSWDLTYSTIGTRSRRVSQRAFLRNLSRGEAYLSEAPTLWDVDFQTAVAQAETEDRPTTGSYHRLAFHSENGSVVPVDTTRPELLAACVAAVVHPGDGRWAPLVGSSVATPLFGVQVPVLAHRLADPEKGTGVAMICTFGDSTDVIWWRELNLATRGLVQRDGRLQKDVPPWITQDQGVAAWREIAEKTTMGARERIVQLLGEAGELLGQARPIEHDVKFYERGEQPLEIVTSRQWYIANGARDQAWRERLVTAGRDLAWHPEFMRVRYEHWVEGLNSDWLVSRQQPFGIPFPVWYPVDSEGATDHAHPIVPNESSLPIDPQTSAPVGYDESQRGAPGGFVGDPDVMDTWATSSLTPQIAAGWEDDAELFEHTFPMDLRPQGPEIIRTWMFTTVLRSQLEHGGLPWSNASINGWILDPERKKMSKSKGNVVTPASLLAEHGADGVRYWSCCAAPGTDTAVDPAQMKVGRRLAIKVLNASRFVLSFGPGEGVPSEPLDLSLLAKLSTAVREATDAFKAYRFDRALDVSETFFWSFCDDYLELVKSRAYGGDAQTKAQTSSARLSLTQALSVQLRLLAPFLPFATEEVWSWWQDGSVHRAPWPKTSELPARGDPGLLGSIALVLGEVRKVKAGAKRSLRTPVNRVEVGGPPQLLARIQAASDDLRAAGHIEELVLVDADSESVGVELS